MHEIDYFKDYSGGNQDMYIASTTFYHPDGTKAEIIVKDHTLNEVRARFAEKLHIEFFGVALGDDSSEYSDPEEFLETASDGWTHYSEFRPTAELLWSGIQEAMRYFTVHEETATEHNTPIVEALILSLILERREIKYPGYWGVLCTPFPTLAEYVEDTVETLGTFLHLNQNTDKTTIVYRDTFVKEIGKCFPMIRALSEEDILEIVECLSMLYPN
jgi:hypothetical protein